MREQIIEVNSSPVYYQIAGSGKSVLILHGWRSSSQAWTLFQQKLAGEKAKVIIPDLPGFGKTPLPSTEGWPLNYYSRWVESFTQELEKKGELSFPFTLIGHSFGGRIAIKLAARKNHSLSSLILVDAAGLAFQPNWRKKIMAKIAKEGEEFLTAFHCSPNFKENLKILIYRLIRQKDYLKVSPEMRKTFQKIIGEDLFSLLPKIDVPTLIIWGAKDSLLPVDQASLFNEKIPHSQLKIITEAAHSPQLDTPEKFLSLVIDFLQRND